MAELVKAERRTILVHWRNSDGLMQTDRRAVFFERGFGHYVKHKRRYYLLHAPDTASLTIDARTPSAPEFAAA